MKILALWLCLGATLAVLTAMSRAFLEESRKRRRAAGTEMAWMLVAALIAIAAAWPSVRDATRSASPATGHAAATRSGILEEARISEE